VYCKLSPEDIHKNLMLIAVNGTLMKGLSANYILIEAGAKFVREGRTASLYRLWNIGDKHPAMLRDEQDGASISLELWEISPERMIEVLEVEPPGLVMGRVLLDNGDTVMGILAEPYLLTGSEEITHYLGWREFQSARAQSKEMD
jgi:gamma-glutamylcyclotransferase (GGCT)/AIG2-like uncharacterized protein YtfP